MASIFDVMDALEAVALATCYPDGTDAPSITGRPIDVAQGWVIAADLDAGLKAGQSFVSVYAVPSSTSKQPVPLQGGIDPVLAPPAYGMTATVDGETVAVAGQPVPREYLTLLIKGAAYSAAASDGDLTAGVVAALVSSLSPDYPLASATQIGDATLLSIPGSASITARIGAPSTLGRVIDRQRSNIMLGVWAPTPADRATIGSALKIAVAQNLTVDMPDTSRSIWIAMGESLSDKNQVELAYRYDQTVQVQWDTLDSYEGFEVTSVDIRLPGPSGSSRAY